MPCYECELELEDELESELEDESEEFLGDVLGRWFPQGSKRRKFALAAARDALKGGLGAVGSGLGAVLLPDKEFEAEDEVELLGDDPEALMERLGDAACRARSEAEAEAFIGALIPLAAKLIPTAARVIRGAAPQLIRGASRVVKTLRRSPVTRKLVRTVPTIIKNTARDVARQVARGKRVTGRSAVRSLARNTARTLSSPRRSASALRQCQALNRRYLAENRALRARLGRR